MTTIFSEQERKLAVTNFVAALYNKKGKVFNHLAVCERLNDKRIKPLCDLQPSGLENYRDEYGLQRTRKSGAYTLDDGQKYFEWLTHVVDGAIETEDDIRKKAYDQMFILILALQDSTQMTSNIELVRPYDWDTRLKAFENKIADMCDTAHEIAKEMKINSELLDDWLSSSHSELSNLSNSVDKRTKEMAEVLEKLLKWMQQYSPILDGIDKEYKGLIKKGK